MHLLIFSTQLLSEGGRRTAPISQTGNLKLKGIKKPAQATGLTRGEVRWLWAAPQMSSIFKGGQLHNSMHRRGVSDALS